MAEVALQAPIAKVYPGMNILRLWGDHAVPPDVHREMKSVAAQWKDKCDGAEIDGEKMAHGIILLKSGAKDVAVVWVEEGRLSAGTYFVYSGEITEDPNYRWERRQVTL